MKKTALLIISIIFVMMTSTCSIDDLAGLAGDLGLNSFLVPMVAYVQPVEVDRLKVVFTTIMEESSSENISNYFILDNALNITAAQRDKISNNIVYLYTSDMSPHTNYQLSYSNILSFQSSNIIVATNGFYGYGSDDTTPPVIYITEPVGDQLLGKYFEVYGSASDDKGVSYVEMKIDGDVYKKVNGSENWSSNINTSVINESYAHVIYVKAVDLKGNAAVSYVVVNVDRTDPVFAIDEADVANSVINSGEAISFHGTAWDENNISYISIDVSNLFTNYLYTATWTGVSNWTFDFLDTVRQEEQSTNVFLFKAIDTAGNEKYIEKKRVIYSGKTVYVSPTGDNNGDGSWYYPVQTVAAAKTRALSLGAKTLKIAEGTYSESLFIDNSMTYQGSWTSNFTVMTEQPSTIIPGAYNVTLADLGIADMLEINGLLLISDSGAPVKVTHCNINHYLRLITSSATYAEFSDNLMTYDGTFFRTFTERQYTFYFHDNVFSNINAGTEYLFYAESGGGPTINNLKFENNLFIDISTKSVFYNKHHYSGAGPTFSGKLEVLNNTFTNINSDIAVIVLYDHDSAFNYNFQLVFEDNDLWGNAHSNIIRSSIFQDVWGGTGNLPADLNINRNNFYMNADRGLDINNGYSTSFAIGYLLDLKQNVFTTNQNVHIYERTVNASPISIVSNTFPEFPKPGGGAYYYDANGAGFISNISGLEALDVNYFGNTNTNI